MLNGSCPFRHVLLKMYECAGAARPPRAAHPRCGELDVAAPRPASAAAAADGADASTRALARDGAWAARGPVRVDRRAGAPNTGPHARGMSPARSGQSPGARAPAESDN